MSNTIAIRVPDSLVKQIRQWTKAKKKSRSQVIREALHDYFEREALNANKDPYSVLVSLMPFEGSGIPDLAAQSKTYLRDKFHARSRSH